MTVSLWPPIGTIRAAQGIDTDEAASAGAAAPADDRVGTVVPPSLLDLVQRRRAADSLAGLPAWREGHLLCLTVHGQAHGVLLDRVDATGGSWSGWLASAEVDWAGPFDVLLETEDEPFEPALGLIQAWNPVALHAAPGLAATVMGRVSANRLAAIRSVSVDAIGEDAVDVAPEPGRIGLRTTTGGWTVLTGTPLRRDDPRWEYQAIYRAAAARFTAAAGTVQEGVVPARQSDPEAESAWQRIVGWFGADRWVRPAFAGLLVVVLLQGAGWWHYGAEPDDVRFRGSNGVTDQSMTIGVRLRPRASIDELAALIQSAGAGTIVGLDGPDGWQFTVPDLEAARRAMAASGIVDSVRMP